jgi:hypothetical protein
MILPDVVLYQTDNEKLRKLILAEFGVHRVLNMGGVFHKVTRPACILVLERGQPRHQLIRAADLSEVRKEDKPREIESEARYISLSQSTIQELPGVLFVTSNPSQYAIWTKVLSVPHQHLSDLVDEDGIQRGVSPDLKDAFLVDSQTANSLRLEIHKLRRVLTGGKHVKRYFINRPDLLLIYTNRKDNFQELENIRAYIDRFKSRITCKEVQQHKHPLYSLHRPREERIFLKKQKLFGVRHDRMIDLVETMLKLHKQLAAAKTSHEKSLIQRQIDATDKQIDQLVYELYSLTDEEIRIVEEATK